MGTPHATPLSQATTPEPSRAIRFRNLSILMRDARPLGAVLTLLTMLALKRHYSLATADQLDWILAPTATMVAWLTSAHPVYEFGVGYVDFGRGIIVAPACAGVNFMIMAFGMTMLCGFTRITRLTGVLAWLIGALCLAYLYTLLVNAVRIGLSMALYEGDFYTPWLTPPRVHRLAGILLYLGALWVYFVALQTLIHRYYIRFNRLRPPLGWTLPNWLPMGWYVVGAAGVPLVNQLFHSNSAALLEHCLTICGVTLGIMAMGWAAMKTVTQFRRPIRKANSTNKGL